MTEQTTLKVNGMSCTGCARNVEKSLKGLSGVFKASVDLKAGTAQVVYDPEKVSRQDLIKAVKNTGYGAA